MKRTRRILLITLAAICIIPMLGGCGNHMQHTGRLPFSLMEKPPAGGGEKMAIMIRNDHPGTPAESAAISRLLPGDVIAFHMSHREAWSHLRKGKIQKLPYDILRYGHIALMVPDPERSHVSPDLRLLQIAMKQAANADKSTDYLKGKHWVAYRPCGDTDVVRLHEFSREVLVTAGDEKRAYDYLGILGIHNSPFEPETVSGIGGKFSCATLVVAGLHYSGHKIAAVHRNGWFDMVTPRQVVESSARLKK